jgi:hypothetical protein
MTYDVSVKSGVKSPTYASARNLALVVAVAGWVVLGSQELTHRSGGGMQGAESLEAKRVMVRDKNGKARIVLDGDSGISLLSDEGIALIDLVQRRDSGGSVVLLNVGSGSGVVSHDGGKSDPIPEFQVVIRGGHPVLSLRDTSKDGEEAGCSVTVTPVGMKYKKR